MKAAKTQKGGFDTMMYSATASTATFVSVFALTVVAVLSMLLN